MTLTVGDLVTALEAAYPPQLAEEWDTGIGLTCGDPADSVTAVLVAVDATAAVVNQAQALQAQLLVTHHPLLFAPVHSVAADTGKGALVHRLIRSGIAHFAAHTNADKAVGGVNDALAETLGLTGLRPLHADPAAPTGIGRVGELAAPMPLKEFVELVARTLPPTVGGVRAAGDPDRTVRTVAVCGGAGDSELAEARVAGADVYLTSDLRHHVVSEFVERSGAPAVVEVAHWAGEWPWLARVEQVIDAAVAFGWPAGSVKVTVSALRTDPWTMHRPSGRRAIAADG